MPEHVLFERGEAFQLYPEHHSIYETIRSIYYLLGEDRPHTD